MPKITVYLSEKVKAKLQERRRNNQRSLSAEIAVMVERCLAWEEQNVPPGRGGRK